MRMVSRVQDCVLDYKKGRYGRFWGLSEVICDLPGQGS